MSLINQTTAMCPVLPGKEVCPVLPDQIKVHDHFLPEGGWAYKMIPRPTYYDCCQSLSSTECAIGCLDSKKEKCLSPIFCEPFDPETAQKTQSIFLRSFDLSRVYDFPIPTPIALGIGATAAIGAIYARAKGKINTVALGTILCSAAGLALSSTPGGTLIGAGVGLLSTAYATLIKEIHQTNPLAAGIMTGATCGLAGLCLGLYPLTKINVWMR